MQTWPKNPRKTHSAGSGAAASECLCSNIPHVGMGSFTHDFISMLIQSIGCLRPEQTNPADMQPAELPDLSEAGTGELEPELHADSGPEERLGIVFCVHICGPFAFAFERVFLKFSAPVFVGICQPSSLMKL